MLAKSFKGHLAAFLIMALPLVVGCDTQTPTLSPDAPGVEWAEAPASLVKTTFGERTLPEGLTRANIVDQDVFTTETGYRLLVVTYRKPNGGTCQGGMIIFDPSNPQKEPGTEFRCDGRCSDCVVKWDIGDNTVECFCRNPGNGCSLHIG